MELLQDIIQVTVALGLINVWIVRYNNKTPFRGGQAKTLKEEFAAYGLPSWSYYLIGLLKLLGALLLIIGLWVKQLVLPAAILITLLMAGAVYMHFKIKDPWIKALPAFTMLILALVIIIF